VQIREMADPDWMYHQPAPDPWEQTLNKWENRKVEAYEQKDNDGVAFTNNKKTEEWHAEFTGKAMVDGKMYWVSISDKTSNLWRISILPQPGKKLPRRIYPGRVGRGIS